MVNLDGRHFLFDGLESIVSLDVLFLLAFDCLFDTLLIGVDQLAI